MYSLLLNRRTAGVRDWRSVEERQGSVQSEEITCSSRWRHKEKFIWGSQGSLVVSFKCRVMVRHKGSCLSWCVRMLGMGVGPFEFLAEKAYGQICFSERVTYGKIFIQMYLPKGSHDPNEIFNLFYLSFLGHSSPLWWCLLKWGGFSW